jgi:glycosidase
VSKINYEQLVKYRNTVIYQVYPKSFADSNGDGIGDIQGIISKLTYIKSLSVDAIWISPCFPSPGIDNGYDVSDYKDIAPEYGTLADMEELIDKAGKLGIGIILDLVANHTSSEHEWFKKSRMGKDNEYSDFYYWSDEPLNGWKSAFGNDSAWIYDGIRKQYYLASFAPEQPDLNWTNPKVREAIADVVDFWINKGVYGFRCDVLDMISKEFDKPGGNGNGPELHEYINQIFGRKIAENIFTVGECWSSRLENMQKICGLDRHELCCSFQNDHRAFGYDFKTTASIPYNLKDVASALSKWQKMVTANDLLYSLFWENHDSPRIVTRFGDETKRFESATMLSTMLFLLSGVVFLYEGQELGLINNKFYDISDFDDISAKNAYNELKDKDDCEEFFAIQNFFSRDNARRMIPWTDKLVPAWIKTDESQLQYNVADQENNSQSVLNYFRKMLAFKKANAAFSLGSYREISIDDNAFIYERTYNDDRFILVCNFKNTSTPEVEDGEVVLSNLDRKSAKGTYQPYECAVIKVTK